MPVCQRNARENREIHTAYSFQRFCQHPHVEEPRFVRVEVERVGVRLTDGTHHRDGLGSRAVPPTAPPARCRVVRGRVGPRSPAVEQQRGRRRELHVGRNAEALTRVAGRSGAVGASARPQLHLLQQAPSRGSELSTVTSGQTPAT